MGYFIVLHPMSLLHPLGNPLSLPSTPPKLGSISKIQGCSLHGKPKFQILRWLSTPYSHLHMSCLSASNIGTPENEAAGEAPVHELKVPDSWLSPSNALQESEWLRVALHKWLDDEYCPEAANVEISKVAARSYYDSLMAQQSDLGEILLKMARDLEKVSFQESFHGAFSSANAAIHLITSRMNSTTG
ncbi:hypothetical protein Cni_G24630 [Canna indica]|uniref:Uncharacterized protein n=1 Tax=Canna indica TaxID=4628 RepID=A0AAQ3KW44_9LILI|nr:hypothetical protein Cni_G24630 [Canna indica]